MIEGSGPLHTKESSAAIVEGVESLDPGEVVHVSSEDLRTMSFKQLVRLAHKLNIGVEGLEERTEVLTRLSESATDIDIED